ncbi:MAG: hypothetical protein AAFQ37_10440 [Bacteroidota bacterium]
MTTRTLFLFALLCVLLSAACNNSDDTPTINEDLIGTWDLVSFQSEGDISTN